MCLLRLQDASRRQWKNSRHPLGAWALERSDLTAPESVCISPKSMLEQSWRRYAAIGRTESMSCKPVETNTPPPAPPPPPKTQCRALLLTLHNKRFCMCTAMLARIHKVHSILQYCPKLAIRRSLFSFKMSNHMHRPSFTTFPLNRSETKPPCPWCPFLPLLSLFLLQYQGKKSKLERRMKAHTLVHLANTANF